MSTSRQNPEELFDRAVAATRDQEIDARTIAMARERVARRLSAELDDAPAASGQVATAIAASAAGANAAAAAGTDATPDHRIRGCEGFRSLIPAYLANALSEPQRILFEDHTRECVPCRRALAEARRQGAAGSTSTSTWQSKPSRRRTPAMRYAIAAGLAGLVATGAVLLSGRLGIYGPDASAHVRAIEGDLQALDGSAVRPIAAGDLLARGNTVRTGSGSGAVLELADGSRVELAQRSQLTLARRSDGVVLDLERGALIVEAAEQKRGHLYVRTDDCLVSVVGTIFSVNHGVRGSRVSVVAGEVHVDRSGFERAVLRPGQQLATTMLLGRVPITREIAWSRNASQYRERIAALASLGREIDATLATGGRTSTALLDRAPAATSVWVGLPNVADELSEAWALVEKRVAENPVLADWWNERFAGGEAAAHITEALAQIRELGSHLGEEVAVAVVLDDEANPVAPLVMAEVVDDSGFDALLDAQIAKINDEAGATKVRRIDDPSRLAGADGGAIGGESVLYLWHSADGLFVASTSVARLAEIARSAGGAGAFAGTKLHDRLAAVYRDGTGWLVGVDIGRILSGERLHAPAEAANAFAALGLDAAENFLVENETVNGANETRATLAFAGERRGAAAWLAAPAASGALEFVSGSASVAFAALSENPVDMFDDLLAAARAAGGETMLEELQRIENELGFSVRDDLATTLGGDVAFAIDGPLLPVPSWKLVIEVTDPSRFEYVLGRVVEAANREAVEAGRPEIRFGQEDDRGRRFLTLASTEGALQAEMTFADGYLIAAPSRALLLDAIATHEAGTWLTASSKFRDLLPSDAETDFSALVWQDLGGAAGPLSSLLGSALPEAEREEVAALVEDAGPMLLLAYGDPDAVRFVARGGSGPFGFSFEKLLAVAGIVGEHAESAGDEAGAAAGEAQTRPRTTA